MMVTIYGLYIDHGLDFSGYGDKRLVLKDVEPASSSGNHDGTASSRSETKGTKADKPGNNEELRTPSVEAVWEPTGTIRRETRRDKPGNHDETEAGRKETKGEKPGNHDETGSSRRETRLGIITELNAVERKKKDKASNRHGAGSIRRETRRQIKGAKAPNHDPLEGRQEGRKGETRLGIITELNAVEGKQEGRQGFT